ncbi:MAG: BON domain-containing protein [Fimbriimonadales bacterium]|nr:BON domain-containing protein [Fimbriimonadales bacterium]
MKHSVVVLCLAFAVGCGMSEDEVRQKAGDTAVAGKRAVDTAAAAMKNAYDHAAEVGKEYAVKAGEAIDDATLKGKVVAAMKLIDGLDSSAVSIEVKDGMAIASGTVKTEKERMMVEGVLYGVTGGKYKNEVVVR